MPKIQTAGTWRPGDEPIHFVSGDHAQIWLKTHAALGIFPMLVSVAVNEWRQVISSWPGDYPLMVDSGVWSMISSMATDNQRAELFVHLVPEDSPHWVLYRGRWMELLTTPKLLDRVWGVVEIDGGTHEVKTKRRERHEDITGVAAIPVYHPQDPPEYLVHLVETYDRVAISQTKLSHERSAIVSQVAREVDGETWIHWLGASPDREDVLTWIPNSTDSTWIMAFGWYGASGTLHGLGKPNTAVGAPPPGSVGGHPIDVETTYTVRQDHVCVAQAHAAQYAYSSLLHQRRGIRDHTYVP